MRRPKENGANGRDKAGRFTAGNPGGPGNPYVKRTAEIRAALMQAVSDDDLRGIVRALVKKAKRGDTIAAREVFDRLIGKPLASLQVEEITPPGPPQTPEQVAREIEEAAAQEEAERAEQEQRATA